MKNLVSVVLLFAVGCSPQFQVYTDYDPQKDVRSFSKFRWLEVQNVEAGQNPIYYNELNDKRIKSAVADELKTAGYSFDKVNADFIVHYHIMVKDKGVVYTDDLGYCYGKYWMDEQTHLYQYSEGTIIIDIMDAKTNDLIWRGWAVSVLDYETAEGIHKVIKTSIDKIFVEFPHSLKLDRSNQNF
jgi:hypothetical protein